MQTQIRTKNQGAELPVYMQSTSRSTSGSAKTNRTKPTKRTLSAARGSVFQPRNVSTSIQGALNQTTPKSKTPTRSVSASRAGLNLNLPSVADNLNIAQGSGLSLSTSSQGSGSLRSQSSGSTSSQGTEQDLAPTSQSDAPLYTTEEGTPTFEIIEPEPEILIQEIKSQEDREIEAATGAVGARVKEWAKDNTHWIVAGSAALIVAGIAIYAIKSK